MVETQKFSLKCYNPQMSIQHGTCTGYSSYRCRCEECVAAMLSYRKEYYSKNKERLRKYSLDLYYKNKEIWPLKERKIEWYKTHPLYRTWCKMKTRCYNSNENNYERYGGRGIRVCEEWKNSYQEWYDYVSSLENFGELGRTLDRIDNNGNYEPGNMKWSTWVEQNNNRRPARKRKR